MSLGGAERGQVVQVGAILLFGFLVVAFSLYQATVVPQQNEGVELNDYLSASEDLQELRDAVASAGYGGTPNEVTVRTGTTYPSRSVARNPGPATGSLTTTGTASFVVSNAKAVDPAAADYWDGSDRSFETRRVVFRPAYYYFDAPQVSVSSAVVAREAGGGIALSGQSLVSGRDVSFLTVEGSLGQAATTTGVGVHPVSTASGGPLVESADGSPIELTVPTSLSEAAWRDLLAAERTAGTVTSVTKSGGAVTIALDGSRRYRLRLGRVAVRSSSAETAPSAPTPAYLTTPDSVLTVPSGGSATPTVVAHDAYGNPLPDVDVTFDTGGGTETVTTDEDGRATASFDPSSDTAVEATFAGYGGDPCDVAPECVTVDVQLVNGGLSGQSGTFEQEAVAFTDGDGTDEGQDEVPQLAPDTTEGDVADFSAWKAEETDAFTASEATGSPDLAVGFGIYGVTAAPTQTLVVEYTFTENPEQLEVAVMRQKSNGNYDEVDSDTDYLIDGSAGSTQTARFELSYEEVSEINSQNVAYLVLTDTGQGGDRTVTVVEIERFRIVSER